MSDGLASAIGWPEDWAYDSGEAAEARRNPTPPWEPDPEVVEMFSAAVGRVTPYLGGQVGALKWLHDQGWELRYELNKVNVRG